MSWSNDETITFLEVYQGLPCIWNPKDVYHKDKKKVADAWSQISYILKKPVKELKAKKDILMATFRKHFKKKQDSIRSGAGTEDIYQPCWFAYQFMESFLMPVYTCHNTLNTETQSQGNFDNIDSESGDGEGANDTSLLYNEILNTPRPSPTSTQTQSRHRSAPNLAEQQMAAAFGELTSVLGRRPPPPEEDECDLYSKLLAKKLRELHKDERQILMYQIDGLFINRLNSNRETPSPQYPYLSNCNVHRPPSTQSSYSEPYEVIHRPPSTQSSYSESNETAPKRLHSYPLHAKLAPKYRRTSFLPPQPPLNTRENEDTINLYSAQYFSSNNENSNVHITSDQTIVPSSEANILTEALFSSLQKHG